jgi:hypothetical protein
MQQSAVRVWLKREHHLIAAVKRECSAIRLINGTSHGAVTTRQCGRGSCDFPLVFFSFEPGLVSANSKRAVVLSTEARLGSARPPILDSQYRPARNNCQEFNAGYSEKVTKCTIACD